MTPKRNQNLRAPIGSKSHRTDSWSWLWWVLRCTHQHLTKAHKLSLCHTRMPIMITSADNCHTSVSVDPVSIFQFQ